MRDEMDARVWVAHGAAFAEALDRLFANIGVGLRRLHAMQFDAPWKTAGDVTRAGRPGQA